MLEQVLGVQDPIAKLVFDLGTVIVEHASLSRHLQVGLSSYPLGAISQEQGYEQ